MGEKVLSTQYDQIAPVYDDVSNRLTFRPYVEIPSFFSVLGSVVGKSVIDLACGDGLYSRALANAGAARVVAMDISPDMLERARVKKAEVPVPIEYRLGDVADLKGLERFDVVTAAYLLHYAKDRAHLEGMTRAIAASLAPGGRFVTLVPNPAYDAEGPAATKYGMTVHMPKEPIEGMTLYATVELTPPVVLEYRYFTKAAYEAVLRDVGFVDIQWTLPTCTEAGLARFGADYWTDYLEHPHAVILSAWLSS